LPYLLLFEKNLRNHQPGERRAFLRALYYDRFLMEKKSQIKERKMPSTTEKIHALTVKDYLALEQDGEIRHEYVNGQIYAMSGASRKHGLIVGALFAALRPAARQRGCQLFTSDMKVRIEQTEKTFFYYPDLVLTCDANDREDYYLRRPCLLFEVLSNSTERLDRHEKYAVYTQLASLQAYVLVAQDKGQVEVYRRDSNNWIHHCYSEGSIYLNYLALDLPIAQIYEDVTFRE
jgi:Uma2 family endonuclease